MWRLFRVQIPEGLRRFALYRDAVASVQGFPIGYRFGFRFYDERLRRQ
jgi:hypothetical protein